MLHQWGQSNSLSPSQKSLRHVNIPKGWEKTAAFWIKTVLDRRKHCFTYTLQSHLSIFYILLAPHKMLWQEELTPISTCSLTAMQCSTTFSDAEGRASHPLETQVKHHWQKSALLHNLLWKQTNNNKKNPGELAYSRNCFYAPSPLLKIYFQQTPYIKNLKPLTIKCLSDKTRNPP